MGKGPTKERSFEFILRELKMSERNIGWVLSKLDSQEYILDECQYMARIHSKESETGAKEIFINRFFALNIRGMSSENKLNEVFQDCIDKKKYGHYLKRTSAPFV